MSQIWRIYSFGRNRAIELASFAEDAMIAMLYVFSFPLCRVLRVNWIKDAAVIMALNRRNFVANLR